MNGRRDDGEESLPGLQVTLQSIQQPALGLEERRETTTDNQGRYRFDDLPSGVYLLEIADPPVLLPTTPLKYAVSVDANVVAAPPPVGFYRPPWVVYLPMTLRH
jgi:hypothetical protein